MLPGKLLLCIFPIPHWRAPARCWILALSASGVLPYFETSFLPQQTDKCWSSLKAAGPFDPLRNTSVPIVHLWAKQQWRHHAFVREEESSSRCSRWGKNWRNSLWFYHGDKSRVALGLPGFAAAKYLEIRLSLSTFVGFTCCHWEVSTLHRPRVNKGTEPHRLS